jgi:nucleotide-binding universal stress UspA family protein
LRGRLLFIFIHQKLWKNSADYKSESLKIVERCKEMANKSGVNINTVLLEGDPAFEIMGYSDREKFDLIIIGSRGMGKFKEMIIGSVSNKVLHHAKCSIMLVR